MGLRVSSVRNNIVIQKYLHGRTFDQIVNEPVYPKAQFTTW
jgi:hypothetical protein